MKIWTGKVVSNKQDKTIVVEVERFHRHPIYERRIRLTKKYQVHSENPIEVGETVRFEETRPISKTKRWKVVAEKAKKGIKAE
jgi:small subunit ribosomal protein S17